jgi:hypothetical protein
MQDADVAHIAVVCSSEELKCARECQFGITMANNSLQALTLPPASSTMQKPAQWSQIFSADISVAQEHSEHLTS